MYLLKFFDFSSVWILMKTPFFETVMMIYSNNWFLSSLMSSNYFEKNFWVRWGVLIICNISIQRRISGLNSFRGKEFSDWSLFPGVLKLLFIIWFKHLFLNCLLNIISLRFRRRSKFFHFFVFSYIKIIYFKFYHIFVAWITFRNYWLTLIFLSFE